MASRRAHSRVQREENAALLGRLFEDHRARLLDWTRNHCECPEDAEDVLGDTCVRFLECFDGEGEQEAGRWMFFVSRRRAREIARRRRERNLLAPGSEELPEERPGEEPVAPDRGPAELVEASASTAVFVAAFATLKEDERYALTMLAFGYGYDEIADSRGWSRTKVNRSLAEGRARLRTLLGAEGGETS
jgi:RNA polymerase sigma factor (sigma-70 family)